MMEARCIFLQEAKNNRCIAKITDNGKGMNKEDVSKLFEPYFTTKEKGTGLGLTNTQNIILAHNANISVESEPGKGNYVYIILQFCIKNLPHVFY